MWVLEARYKAEKVWFPVVWEEKKDASNVIDYDIRDEITKDTSAEINSNNQTTTGMATVIPWVNAPKLLENTSIIKEKTSSLVWVISVVDQYTEHEDNPRYWTVMPSSVIWNWITYDDYLITFNIAWTYLVEIRQQQLDDSVYSSYRVNSYLRKNLQTIDEAHYPYWPECFTYSWPIEFVWWDTLWIAWWIWNIPEWRSVNWQWPIYDISIIQIS